MKYALILSITLTTLACGGLPTEPSQAPPQPAAQTTSAPDPAPPTSAPQTPVPLPAPAPTWRGEVGHAYGDVDLPGHFDMKITATVLQFANHGADIVTQNQDGLFAVLFRPTLASPTITITIQFDSPTHGLFRWEGPQQYAVGEVVYR